MKRLAQWPGLVFAVVFAWKLLLFLISTQSIPANDSFFYDGAVVNYVLHGQYVNPSLANVFPISGTQVYSAYPPLYQASLTPWMTIFGTSVPSQVGFHLVLYGGWLLLVFATLRRLGAPAIACHLAGLFLLVITFNDRPDSLAHFLGALGIYSWVRGSQCNSPATLVGNGWYWTMAAMSVLTLATSLQIGGVYFCLFWLGLVTESCLLKRRPPLAALGMMTVIPPALILMVIKVYPQLWAGFMEHASITPSWTGFRFPGFADLLKAGRTVPTAPVVALLLPLWLWQSRIRGAEINWRVFSLCFATLAATLSVVLGALSVLTPNLVAIGGYLQPLLVGTYVALAVAPDGRTSAGQAPTVPGVTAVTRFRAQAVLLVCLALLGSIRAIGMSTWGVVCASDVSYTTAIARVRNELATAPQNSTVALSSAFLYDAARHKDLRWIHCDWLGRYDRSDVQGELKGLLAVRPSRLLLTQFDYYRRFNAILAQLPPDAAKVTIENTAKIPAPDASPKLQRVVQQIAWAPVIVRFEWAEPRQGS